MTLNRRSFGFGALSVAALGACATDDAPPLATPATPRALKDADIATRLTGHWIVAIDETSRTRQLEILNVRPEADGRFGATARYGFTGERLQSATLRGRETDGVLTIGLVAPNKNEISARLGVDGRFQGEIRYKTGDSKGTTRRLAIRETDVERLTADKYVVRRDSKLTLVYVSAGNCGPCSAWERDIGPGTKRVFLSSPTARVIVFRQVDTATYMHTNEARHWPEDLRWLIGATNVASGTPRYIVLADRKIVLNSHGRFSTRVEPLLRDLAARKERGEA